MAVLLCILMILTDQQIAPIDVAQRRGSDFTAGDTVRVHQKIAEKDKTRIQIFEGTVISRKHGTEPGATFTVRRIGTDGIAVEKIFPLYTPTIDRIEVSQKIKTRRAKLYFLRGRTPKQIREKLRNTVATIKDAVVQQERPEDIAAQEQEAEKEEAEQHPAAEQSRQQKQDVAQETPSEEQLEVEAQHDTSARSKIDDAAESAQTNHSETPPESDQTK